MNVTERKAKRAKLMKYMKDRDKRLAEKEKGKKKAKKKSTGFELLESDPTRKMRNSR